MPAISVNGVTLSYEEAGSGQAIILLHGYPFNRSMWREQVEALSPKYRVITPDLRGLGESSGTDEPATMAQMASDVAALMDHLGIDRAVIGGLSMGGYVALAFYRRHELRVRALVLADTRATADTDEAKANRERQALAALSEGMQPIVDAMLPKLFAASTVEQKPEVVERVREMMMNTDPKGAAAALRGMAVRIDHTDFLPSIIPPTLIILGSDDQITPVSNSEEMHRGVAGSRLEIIDGAGHVSNIEKPSEFNRAVQSFLISLEP
jgi:3-oxoadipate enol-lactonase